MIHVPIKGLCESSWENYFVKGSALAILRDFEAPLISVTLYIQGYVWFIFSSNR